MLNYRIEIGLQTGYIYRFSSEIINPIKMETGTITQDNRSSYIDNSAKVGAGFICGEFCVIEKNVVIGSGCTLGHHVIIREGTWLGNNTRVDDNTVIGKQPLRSKRSIFKSDKKYEPAKIGDECL